MAVDTCVSSLASVMFEDDSLSVVVSCLFSPGSLEDDSHWSVVLCKGSSTEVSCYLLYVEVTETTEDSTWWVDPSCLYDSTLCSSTCYDGCVWSTVWSGFEV